MQVSNSMVMTSLPPGFRFHPTDVELVEYYLKRKVTGKLFHFDAISEIELYKFSPWELPEKSLLRCRDLEWYFFCPRNKKYPNGTREKRATDNGYWKSTGKDRPIIHNTRIIGMKKTLVFHLGKAPKGDRTDWIMHEYRLVDKQLVDVGCPQDAYALCKIFKKSGAGPRIGEQHGAPFNEEEWDNKTAEDPISLVHSSCPSSTLLEDPAVISSSHRELPAACGVVDAQSNSEFSDIDGMWLEELMECLDATPIEDKGTEKMSDPEVLCPSTTQASTSEPNGIFDGLEDLSNVMFKNTSFYDEHNVLPSSLGLRGEEYLELNDFDCLDEEHLFELNDLLG